MMIPRLLQHRPIERSDMQARTALPDRPILQRGSTAISTTSSQDSIDTAPSSSSSSSPLPPPPPTPQAWIWRCHICNATFRLSCTRRCLHCGHVMCTTPPPPQPSSNSGSRRRSRAGPCAMEFDYERWAAWGDWRRFRHMVEEEDTLRQETKPYWGEREAHRKRRLYDRVGSCRDDCDYPSECHHLRSEMRQRFTVVDSDEVSPISPPSMEEAARSILRMGVEEADCVFAAADYLESRFARAHRGENSGLGFDVYVDAPERQEWEDWWDDDSGYGAASEDEDVDMVYEDIRG